MPVALKKALVALLLISSLIGVWISVVALDIHHRGISMSLHSNILGEERHLMVYLPYGYDDPPQQKYDVLYTLDGERIRNNVMPTTTAAVLQDEGFMDGIIVVAIDGMGKRMRDYGLDNARPYEGYDGKTAGEASKFLSFLETELIPHIETNYRTSEYNLLAGHSMGGLFTTYAFIEKPKLFHGYLAFSPTYPAAIGTVERFEETLQANPNFDGFIYLNLGVETLGGYDKLVEQAEAGLEQHAPPKMGFQVEYYPLLHSMVMAPGYLLGLIHYYSFRAEQEAARLRTDDAPHN